MTFPSSYFEVATRDWQMLFYLLLAVAAILGTAETSRRFVGGSTEFPRKFVHIALGVPIFLAPFLIHRALPAIMASFFFAVFDLAAVKKGWFPAVIGEKNNYGTVFYPVSFLILAALAWERHPALAVVPMIILAFADGAAAVAGGFFRRSHDYVLLQEKKSWEGTATMFVVSLLAVLIGLTVYGSAGKMALPAFPKLIWISLLTALVATAAEAVSRNGSDNLTVPLLSGAVLYFLLQSGFPGLRQMTVAVLASGVVGGLSYRQQFLTAGGTGVMFIFGVLIFGIGGIVWSIPIVVFFLFSSVLSKLRENKNSREISAEGKGSRRDEYQVLANGGVAVFLLLIHLILRYNILFMLYLATLAAATADTWATEIGMWLGKEPRLITSGKKVARGISGGVTLAGSLGALMGSCLLVLSGVLAQSIAGAKISGKVAILLALTGFLASLVDSLLGATVQAKFKCELCGALLESPHHCPGGAMVFASGIPWLNNDWVNFLATISAVVILPGLLYLLP